MFRKKRSVYGVDAAKTEGNVCRVHFLADPTFYHQYARSSPNVAVSVTAYLLKYVTAYLLKYITAYLPKYITAY